MNTNNLLKSVMSLATLMILCLADAAAQTEYDLKRYFEGRTVTVRMDLPATKNGVDIYAEREQPLRYDRYASRLKRYGVGIRAGEEVMVTKIKVKEKHIEFQLGGGGYGTAGDETEPNVFVPLTSKSRREKRLEEELKNERDERRRRVLREEIDELRRRREREDRRNEAEAATAREIARDRIERRRADGGSRFNIHFDSGLGTRALTPQTVMEALRKYVAFTDFETSVQPRGKSSATHVVDLTNHP